MRSEEGVGEKEQEKEGGQEKKWEEEKREECKKKKQQGQEKEDKYEEEFHLLQVFDEPVCDARQSVTPVEIRIQYQIIIAMIFFMTS